MGFNSELLTSAEDKVNQPLVGFVVMKKLFRRCETAFGFEHQKKAFGVVGAFILGSPVNFLHCVIEAVFVVGHFIPFGGQFWTFVRTCEGLILCGLQLLSCNRFSTFQPHIFLYHHGVAPSFEQTALYQMAFHSQI